MQINNQLEYPRLTSTLCGNFGRFWFLNLNSNFLTICNMHRNDTIKIFIWKHDISTFVLLIFISFPPILKCPCNVMVEIQQVRSYHTLSKLAYDTLIHLFLSDLTLKGIFIISHSYITEFMSCEGVIFFFIFFSLWKL